MLTTTALVVSLILIKHSYTSITLLCVCYYIAVKDYNMCRNHTECSENHFCEKNADLVYGFCRLSGNYYNLYSV